MDHPMTLYGLLDDLGCCVLIGWIVWLYKRRPAKPKPPKTTEQQTEQPDPNEVSR